MAIKFVNNYQTTLASAISAVATSIDIAVGTGAALGTLGSDIYYLTIYADVNASVKEIVKVTARSTDTLTVVRGQDGTTAQAWSAGAWMEARIPKVILESFSQVAVSSPVAVAEGGTGSTTAAGARTNLGLGTIATQAASAVSITGGSITGITDLTVADGGTGASTHTANAVLIGNGTSAITSVAPGTSGNVLTSNGTTWASSTPATSGITLGTSTNTTGGTTIDFSGIPSGTKQLTISAVGLSTNGTSPIILQLGDAGGMETSGYTSQGGDYAGDTTSTSGLIITVPTAAGVSQFSYTITLVDAATFLWAGSGNCTGATLFSSAGSKALSQELSQVRLTMSNGTDTFDLLTKLNIAYQS